MTNQEESNDPFIATLRDVTTVFFKLGNFILNNNVGFTQKFDLMVTQEILILETYLDDMGARSNTRFLYLAELIASVRNFANMMFLTKHIHYRIPIYGVEETQDGEERLREQTGEFYEWALENIRNLYREAIKEANSLGIETPTTEIDEHFSMTFDPSAKLEANVVEDDVEDGLIRILELTSKFRKTAKIIQRENFGKRYKAKDLSTLIPYRIDEKKARKFRNNLHGVQSDYDTYVKGSTEEKRHPVLKQLRGFISITMHLLEIVSWMSHFYERHLATVRKTPTRLRLSEVVNSEELLSKMVSFGMNNCHKYLQSGNEVAENILTHYSHPITIELPVPQPIGFHARPSHYLSLIVNEYGTDVFLVIDDEEYSCKSVMTLLQAGALLSEKGAKTVTFKGDEKVLNDIRVLADNNYCEDKEIPTELNYLRIARNFL